MILLCFCVLIPKIIEKDSDLSSSNTQSADETFSLTLDSDTVSFLEWGVDGISILKSETLVSALKTFQQILLLVDTMSETRRNVRPK